MDNPYQGCTSALGQVAINEILESGVLNPHLVERPDREDPAIDFVWFSGAVLAPLLEQC